MSALGNKRTCAVQKSMSAMGQKRTFVGIWVLCTAIASNARTTGRRKMTQWTSRRDRFRAILNGAECVRPASVFDRLSGRIAEHLGFEIGLLAGSTAALTILGSPDLVLVTAIELVQDWGPVNRAGSI